MKERPILFSAPMVRAILEGRKTQTRRVVKPQPGWDGHGWRWEGKTGRALWSGDRPKACALEHGLRPECPYGQLGDRLWVREAWQVHDASEAELCYHADEEIVCFLTGSPDSFWEGKSKDARWHPSIHMPRWASRITLEVTGVRVERLQDTSEEDAMAVGGTPVYTQESWSAFDPSTQGYPSFFAEPSAESVARHGYENVRHHPQEKIRTSRDAFRALWGSLHGYASWDTNPWVWVVEFQRVTP